MESNKVINSAYLIPAILAKLEGTENENVDLMLKEFNVDAEDYRDLYSLLNYHLQVVKTDFNADYPLLRKGLTEYFEKYLSDFWKVVGIEGTRLRLLDYACGDGAYSDKFIEANPEGITYRVDRQFGIDFEATPLWYQRESFEVDIVLLSEILHCKSIKWQEYLIVSSLACLVPGGCIIINENIDPFMGYRLNHLTDHGNMLTENDIIQLMLEYDVKLKSITTINNHKQYTYEKI